MYQYFLLQLSVIVSNLGFGKLKKMILSHCCTRRSAFLQKCTVIGAFLLIFMTGCASQDSLSLMPAPVLYHDAIVDPFAHLKPELQNNYTNVFYATNRESYVHKERLRYGNDVDPGVHFGEATVRMGEKGSDWKSLFSLSIEKKRNKPIPVTLETVDEFTTIELTQNTWGGDLNEDLTQFIDAVNRELAIAEDKEIVLYVHGAKVDFANSVILTAEIDHFSGRDFVGVAFAWPSHQNILSYLFGTDVVRAHESSFALRSLIELLAENTIAEQVNILAYSAGAKVVSRALFEMYGNYPNLSGSDLQNKFRIGSVVFAAADVEVDRFLDRLVAMSELAEQVIVTVAEKDNALDAARKYMGGSVRVGTVAAEEEKRIYIRDNNLSNVVILNVSQGKESRGFDIEGHHYWYRHSWMSSEIIFLLRTGLPPGRRGLTSSEMDFTWYLSSDYPEKIRRAARMELDGQW